jgi:hemerythrin
MMNRFNDSAHARVKVELGQVIKDVSSTSTEYEWIEAGLKVKQLIIEHIPKEDLKYAEYYRNTLAASPAVK